MITALVLINTAPGDVTGIAKAIGSIPEVTEVHSVTGPYDLVVNVQVEEYERMAEVITAKINAVEGITSSTTMMTFRTYKF